ncbi:MAG: cbb3-type cytochrome c oxidase subunit 3 [Gammaproteobacteria bacterium]|nr:MAG: cbb3-type cytochrome c oxidase subunit 3 [Gammaproteobacteria bacterium]
MDATITHWQVTLHSYWTVVLFATFIGIWVWAWSGKRKKAFDEAARLPLEDDDDVIEATKREVNQ